MTSVSVAGFVFQACSIDHSDISPFRINKLRAACANYRTRRRFGDLLSSIHRVDSTVYVRAADNSGERLCKTCQSRVMT